MEADKGSGEKEDGSDKGSGEKEDGSEKDKVVSGTDEVDEQSPQVIVILYICSICQLKIAVSA